MLFIDNYQAQLATLREQTRSCTQHDADLAAPKPVPGLVALQLGQTRVRKREAIAKA